MKKNLVLGAVFAAALFAVSPAKAIDSTGGCGLLPVVRASWFWP